MRKIILFIGVAILVGCTQPDSQNQETPTDLGPFVGAWQLANWTFTADDGTTTYPFGEQAKGQIVYTSSGQMSAQLMRPGADFKQFSGLDGESAIQELERSTFFAYWGRYEVDDVAKTVTHHVEGSQAPTWVGTARIRDFSFENENRLILKASNTDADDPKGVHELTWERVP